MPIVDGRAAVGAGGGTSPHTPTPAVTGDDASRERGAADDRAVVWALAWLVTIAVANTGATAVAQPALQATFGVRPAQVGWVVFGYTAAFAVSTAWYGSAAGRVGAARAISFGASLLALGALVATTATSFSVVVAARIAQGLGAGAIPTLSFAIASERMEGAARARAIGLIVAGVGVGQAAGPLLGGVLIDSVSWRGAVAVGMLALPAVPVVLRLHRSRSDRSVRLDVAGGVQLAAVIGGATWLLNRAPTRGWDLPVGAVVLGVLVAGTIGVRHVRRHPDAFLPLRVLTRRGFPSRLLAGALLMAVFTAVLTGIPLVAGGGARIGGVSLGLLMLPMALTIALVSTNTGRLPARPESRTILVLGLVTLAVAAVLAGIMAGGSSLVLLASALVPVGVAYGLLAVPLTAQVSGLFPVKDRPVALGAYHVGFFVGGAAGGSIMAGAIDGTLPSGERGFAWVMIALAGIAAAGAVAARVRRPGRPRLRG